MSVQGDIREACVSWWPLDEASGTRFDRIGQNHLTPWNPQGSALGLVGNAAQFKQALSHVLFITDAQQQGLNPGLNDFSISMWFRPDLLPAGLFGKGITNTDGPEAPGYGCTIWGVGSAYADSVGSIHTYMGALNPAGTIPDLGHFTNFSNTPIIVGAWYNLVITATRGEKCRAYLNGILSKMTSGFSNIPNPAAFEPNGAGDDLNREANIRGQMIPAASFCLGGFSSNISTPTVPVASTFTGLMQRVGFFNRVLTQSEVLAIYNAGLGISVPEGQ